MRRLFGLALGVGLVAWVALVAQPFRTQANVREAVDGLVHAASFKPGTLDAMLDQADRPIWPPYPALARSVAFLKLERAKTVDPSAKPDDKDSPATKAELAASTSLALNPLDSYAWLTVCLFRIAKDPSVFEPAVQALAMSYATGAREDWIALRRSGIAFLLLPYVDRDTLSKIVGEFDDLATASTNTPILASILVGNGAPYRDRLLQSLSDAPEDTRKQLSAMLYELGVDAKVPGIERRTDRPWD